MMQHILSSLVLLLFTAAATAQVTSTANADSGSGYPALLASGFEIEDPDCVHTDFGPHVTQAFDAELNRNVFVFHSHIVEDNDRCQVFDRVRMEIKGSPGTGPELQHTLGETTYYRWKFRLDEDFIGASSFNHLYQNKAVGGDDTSFPILTITARANFVEVRHDGGDTGNDLGKLVEADISRFRGKWVEGYLRQVHAENGELEVTIRDMATGLTILSYTNNNIDLWRTGAEFNRPKWGIYRSKNDVLRDETVRFANFCVSEQAEALCPAEAVLVPDTEAPTVPTGLVVTGTTFTTVSLDWQASEDVYGVTSYVVYANGDSIATTTGTEAIIPGLTTATTYSFTVAARDDAGNESAPSAAVTATTDDANALPDAATSPSPADGATGVNPQSSLGWARGDNTDSFEIFFGTETDPPSIGSQTTNGYQPAMQANTTYFWRIASTNQNGTVTGPVWRFTTGADNPDDPWYVYRGNARPEVETSFFALNTAPVEPTLDVLFNDPDNPNNSIFGYRSATNENFRWRFDLDEQDSTITIVTRIRGIDADASGMMHLEIRAFGWRQKVRLNSSTIKFERSSPAIEEALPFDWNEGCHIIRLVVTGQTTTVYLDEDTTPFMSGPSNDPRDLAYFEWGKSGGEDYGAFVDWMAVNITEASAPGAGTTLPADLFPSTDGPWSVYRGTARPEVETGFYELNSAPENPVVDMVVADPNGSENTYYGFRSDSDNFRWRYDLDNQDSTITIVARLKAISPDVSGIIYFEVRALGWRQKVRINQSSIKLERSDPAVEADVPFNWNDELHVIRFVITGQTMTVYLDEQSESFLTGTSSEATTSSYFEWGKSGGEDYGAFVDWLAVDATMASAPGTGAALPEDLFLSSDATLATLSVNGVEIDTFAPYQTEYTVQVPGDIAPTVAWTTTSNLATATGMQPDAPADTTLITVVAQDGLTTRTYRLITETASATFDPLLQAAIRVYPNPASETIKVELPPLGSYSARLISVDGRSVMGEFPVTSHRSINVAKLSKGLYVLVVRSESGQLARTKLVIH